MFPFSLLLTPLSVVLSLSTATGVLVHDMHLDKAAMFLAVPAVIASYQASSHSVNFSADQHTHAETDSLSQAVNDLKATSPRIQPRSSDDKKYISQKNLGLGYGAVDSYHVPLI